MDFITQNHINYKDVLIYENVYEEQTPKDAGEWIRLINEMMEYTIESYIKLKGQIAVVPRWLPERATVFLNKEMMESLKDECRFFLLHAEGAVDFILKDNTTRRI